MLLTAVVLITALIGDVHPQKRVGDSCVEKHTNVVGICTPGDECVSAKNDYQYNGIMPTFCNQSFDGPVVCCKDGSNILQTPSPRARQRPTWGSNSRPTKSLSERKCEEYSREVTRTVEFIALIPEPETFEISAAKCEYTGVQLIVGGENANLGEFPHMAAIGWANYDGGYDFDCGGSLISSRFVLTAGHCTYNPRAKDRVPAIVVLGDQNIDPTVKDDANPVEVPIRMIHRHPDYKPPLKYNDIALLELIIDVELGNNIRPACLWTRPDFGGHYNAIATGWGVNDTRNNNRPKELQKVSLSLLENDFCDPLLERNRHWPDGFRDTQMCAGELRGRKDTCQGDSGSPLQVSSNENQCIFHIMGLTSFGKRCATGRPAIYTRVYPFIPWIESVVWPGEQ